MDEQRISIAVDAAVTLEGGYSAPTGQPQGQAMILHPHPLYGGSMDNNVVAALKRGALQAGWGVLRFNFRGTGGSSGQHDRGRGEQEDAVAVAGWLAREHPGRLALLGYSFGALVGSWAAGRLTGLAAGVWVAPALVLGEPAPWPPDGGPLLLMVGDGDEYAPLAGVQAYADSLGARGGLRTFSGGDHFFQGKESVLESETAAWLGKLS